MCGIFNRKRKFSNNDSNKFLGNLSNEKVDMENVIQSIFHSDSLYDKLKIKCHPDRFVQDPILMAKADSLFKEITEKKRDFKKLQELQQIAENELNVKI